MKKTLHMFFLTILSVLAVEGASPPALINYQGRLMDSVGNPVNTSASVHIRVYTDETGGSPVWQQSIPGVVVLDGLCDFAFGDSEFVTALTNEACWMELTIDGETFSPRQRLLSVPYALRVDMADSVETAVSPVPSGLVVMWAGSLDAIPEGWFLCDGSNGTPDLRETFVYGASDIVDPGTTGGANSYFLTTAQLPSHTHSGSSGTAGAHTHTATTTSAGAHGHTASVNSVSHTHDHYQRSYSGTYPKDSFATSPNNGSATVGTSTSGDHAHSVSIPSTGAHTHSITINSGGAHTHSLTVEAAGQGAAVDNRPSTILLAFIMKS